MSTDRLLSMENCHPINDDDSLNLENHSLSSSPSHQSCSSSEDQSVSAVDKSSNSNPITSDASRSKETSLKVPYPVLSDHRDPSSVLVLLQKETQTTSKKILDVSQQIENCEKRLTSTLLKEQEKKSLKCQRVKYKQQLDALKKHERRVNLQIDYMTTKTEIKGLEDERRINENNENPEQNQQIEILLGKLKQKLDKMKIYMRARNEQMKKVLHGKTKSNQLSDEQRKSSSQKQNVKRPPPSINGSSSNKRLKSTKPAVRLASRLTVDQSKIHSNRTAPIVRFLNKTSESMINSASPTTPASSSSTLSPPLIATTSAGEISKETNCSINDEDDELESDLDVDDLFAEDDNICFDEQNQRYQLDRCQNAREKNLRV